MESKLFPVNDLFFSIADCDKRILALQGGARSGKTYSVLQWIVTYFGSRDNARSGYIADIVRKQGASHMVSGRKDFMDILGDPSPEYEYGLGIYSSSKHRKSNPEQYDLNGNTVRFLGIDTETKKRGSKRNILYINEANELEWDDWKQLAMRTSDRIIIDYNPSDEDHWIYDKVLSRPDCTFVQTTWRDNAFLPQSIIDEIEDLRNSDPEAYKVFGLGERAKLTGKIYSNWKPGHEFKGEAIYGLDFGFVNPTCLIKLGMYDGELYAEEKIYQTSLTNSDLIERMKELGIRGRIYCDAAEPQRIEELRRAGFDALTANKSVKDGIDFCKRFKINVVNSPNVEKEIKTYKRRTDKNGNVLEEPLKYNDHAMDALRYGAFTAWYVPAVSFNPNVVHESILDSDFRNWQ